MFMQRCFNPNIPILAINSADGLHFSACHYLSNKILDYELLSENISTMKKVYYGISLNTFLMELGKSMLAIL